ncbi:hypothetical protein DRE_06250 [Drechslerella stenobrocha 248]|uniref:Mitochondrial import inner membrane translocase subunit n=1 Tax=Drechslerella stenobrocha 248 TaxID=1043628 RepID=W7HM98_9PEZI|nr:hypothetical protein DRE_06250 [Drechslerella stenobrocha 248]
MDSSNGSDLSDLSDISANDKKELQNFVTNEAQKAKIQTSMHTHIPPPPRPRAHLLTNSVCFFFSQAVHYLTDKCWKNCITSKISSGQMDSYEKPCMENCVDRYIDAQMTVLKHLEQLRGSM